MREVRWVLELVKERDAVFAEIGQILDVDYERLRDQRLYSLLSGDEVGQAEELGVDIQLHTHRHQLPTETADIEYEITRNRDVLQQHCSSSLDHFCYPSGVWHEEHIDVLKSLGVKSATTCDIGENRLGANPYTLCRFLDRDDISELRFEAEVSGFMPLVRRAARFRTKSDARSNVGRT